MCISKVIDNSALSFISRVRRTSMRPADGRAGRACSYARIAAAVITGITNATAESLNRLAKLEARLAYGFGNPLNGQRRVRVACTRAHRRRSPTATSIRTRIVTGRKPGPGYSNFELACPL
jgi:hypothetical protein